jgi:NTP pyrophosphatase (non-canonical NTP hydrolase)
MIEKLARKAVSMLPEKLEEVVSEVLDEAKKISINTKLVDQVNLNDMAKNMREINKANGFGVTEPDKHQKMIQLMLITTEVAEAAEAYRKHEGDERVAEELADVILRTLDMAAYWGYDIDKAVRDKMEKNKSRGFRHGDRAV